METICIAIGINNYSEDFWLTPLKGCVHDALWFAKVAQERGVPKNNVKLLLNSDATRTEILSTVRRWPRQAGFVKPRFLLFFSGHGYVAKEGASVSVPLLLPYDASIKDPISSSISFYDLLKAVHSVSPSSVFCFFDACKQDIASFILSARELEETLESIQASNNECFFAAIANNAGNAVEGKSGSLGEFSIHLFDVIEELEQQKRTNIASLAELLSARAESMPGLKCSMALIGHPQQWMFDNSGDTKECKIDSNAYAYNYYERTYILEMLIRRFRRRHDSIFIIKGPSYSGKTILIKQLLDRIPRSIYFTLQNGNYQKDQILELCLASIAVEEEQIFPSGRPDFDIDCSLDTIKRSGGIYLFWDHVERIPIVSFKEVCEVLIDANISVIAVTNNNELTDWNNYFIYELPPLSKEEVIDWIAKDNRISIDIDYIMKLTAGNPLMIQRLINGDVSLYDNWKSGIDDNITNIVALTGGFSDVDTFAKAFDLSLNKVIQLSQSPLMTSFGRWKQPHDILIDGKKTYEQSDIISAAQYLLTELTDDNTLVIPAIKLFELANMMCYMDTLWDTYLVEAVDRLRIRNQHSSLVNIASFISRNAKQIPHTYSRYLSWCAERGCILEYYGLIKDNPDMIVSNCKNITTAARVAWWEGDFKECIRLSQQAVAIAETIEVQNAAKLERAIGDFFLGNWANAMETFNTLSYCRNAQLKTRCWSRLMEGTIKGIRGQGVNVAIAQIVNAAQRLMDIGEVIGAAVGFGNAGEISWKAEQYPEAKWLLERGLEYARIAGSRINEIENLRGQLHVEMRTNGQNTILSANIKKELETFVDSSCSVMESMQVLNTLTTCSLMSKELDRANRYIIQARECVEGNKEYEIYWRWNRSILAIYREELGNAIKEFNIGLNLAILGDNRLAIKQMSDDLNMMRFDDALAIKPIRELINDTLKKVEVLL